MNPRLRGPPRSVRASEDLAEELDEASEDAYPNSPGGKVKAGDGGVIGSV